MRKNNGMGHIQLIIMIIIICTVVGAGAYFVYNKYNIAKIETIKTNMLLIEWKAKELENQKTAKGEEKVYIGTKVSEMKEDAFVKPLLEQNIIPSEDVEKYYVLSDENLAELNVDVSNEANSYYIISYEKSVIIFTKGCSYDFKTKLYSLSDIENASQKLDYDTNTEIIEENSEEQKNEESIQQ